MAVPTPLLASHRQNQAILAAYGPGVGDGQSPVEVVASFGGLELEYAGIRRGCVVLDAPQRAVLEVTGSERIEFLNRMVTQNLAGITAGQTRRSFWLNRKGRIDADLRAWHFADRTLLDVDVHAAARTVAGLSGYIITEDVGIRDITMGVHRLAVHGPGALAILGRVVGQGAGAAEVAGLSSDRCVLAQILGTPVVLAREDQTGEIGIEIVMPADKAVEIYNAILSAGVEQGSGGVRVRASGWHAFNIARIEAGVPIYNIDFGPDSLPAETGVFADRVSVTKGCYLGQEIVARMHARGQVRQRLVGIKLARDFPLPARREGAEGQVATPRQPETGSHVFDAEGEGGEPIGAVTSSAISPMLSQMPVCFAMVKGALASEGKEVMVAAEGGMVRGEIQGLKFWERRRDEETK